MKDKRDLKFFNTDPPQDIMRRLAEVVPNMPLLLSSRWSKVYFPRFVLGLLMILVLQIATGRYILVVKRQSTEYKERRVLPMSDCVQRARSTGQGEIPLVRLC
jgi:hypothetical protein